jgi:outer membrane lipase/esterase
MGLISDPPIISGNASTANLIHRSNRYPAILKDSTMRLGSLILAAAVCAATSGSAHASSYSEIVSFGDSLTDTGNVYIGTGGALPGPGYAVYNGYGIYTNPQSGSGPAGLWIDQLAGHLGLSAPAPFLAGGTNYAVGSSFTAGFNGAAPGMDAQVGDYLTSVGGSASASALYTFWGGANDIFAGLNPITAANNVASEIGAVATDGGKTFLWLNLPPLGDTPGILAAGPAAVAAANAAANAFDAQWAIDVGNLDASGINVIGVNVDALFNAITGNPSAYGFTNITSACLATPGCNPNTFLYFDAEHPTTEADSLVANLAAQDLSPTPEPPSVTLVALGAAFAAALALTRRKPQLQS